MLISGHSTTIDGLDLWSRTTPPNESLCLSFFYPQFWLHCHSIKRLLRRAGITAIGEHTNSTSPREYLPVTATSLIWNSRWKLLTSARSTVWYTANGSQYSDGMHGTVCSAALPCLFDLLADPGERRNQASAHADITRRLSLQLASYTPYVSCDVNLTDATAHGFNCSSPDGEAWSPPAYNFQYEGPCCFQLNRR